MNTKNIFAERMKEARIKKGLSQAELARSIGFSPATISSYENGENPKNPSIDKALEIAKGLDVSLDWLCGNIQENTKSELTFEDIIKIIIKLSALDSIKIDTLSETEPLVSISIKNKGISEFVNEYQKTLDFIKNPDNPEYLKNGLLNMLINNFKGKYYISNNKIISSEKEE